jgi:hypothetical protein
MQNRDVQLVSRVEKRYTERRQCPGNRSHKAESVNFQKPRERSKTYMLEIRKKQVSENLISKSRQDKGLKHWTD